MAQILPKNDNLSQLEQGTNSWFLRQIIISRSLTLYQSLVTWTNSNSEGQLGFYNLTLSTGPDLTDQFAFVQPVSEVILWFLATEVSN